MRGISVGCGLLLVLAGALFGLAWLIGITAAGAAGADNAVLAGSCAIMATVLGAALAYAGARGGLSAARRRFGPAAPLLWLTSFVLVLLAGSVIIAVGPTAAAVLLPPLQFLGALLPALAVVGAAAWRRGGAAWRPTLVGLAYGGCGATTLALFVEATIGLVLLLFILSTPDGQKLAEQFSTLLQELTTEQKVGDAMSELLPLLFTPAIIASAFALVGLLGPLSEELAKAIGVALVGPTTRAQAWLWGVTIGAGFGMAEALTFSAMGVDLPNWPITMLTRALTTLMHATMGGIGGLGVYYLLAGRRRSLGIGLLGVAWLGHAAWNCAYLLFAIAGGSATMGGGAWWSAYVAALAGLSIVALFGLVILTFVYVSTTTAREELAAAAAAAAIPPGDIPPELPAAADEPPETAEDQLDILDESAPSMAEQPEPEAAEPTVPEPETNGDSPADVDSTEDFEPDPDGIPGLGHDSTWRPLPDPGVGGDTDKP
jgi:hypothetical protein